MEDEEEVHLGVFCLHMSSDSEKEIECLGSQVSNDNNGSKTGSLRLNYQGVASRTRRAKDKMNGLVKIQSGYRCSCCDANTSKEKHRKYSNKGSLVSKLSVKDESIRARNGTVVEQAIADPGSRLGGDTMVVEQAVADPESTLGGDHKFSPTVKRAVWKPRDEMELASAVLDGINSGLEGVKNGADVMPVNLHSRFWEQISKTIWKKSGVVHSKYQITEKFKKMKKHYFANAMHQGSVVRSNERQEEKLFGILQQIFGDVKEDELNTNATSLTPLEGEVNGNDDQVSQPRSGDNIVIQKASQGLEVPHNGNSFVLCLPSPNQPIILKHPGQDHTAKDLAGEKQSLQVSARERPVKRKLQDTIAVDAKNSENNLPSPLSPSRKLTNTSENIPSSLVSPKRKSAKIASIAAMISNNSQSSERTKSARRASHDERTSPAETSKDNPSSHVFSKIKLVDGTSFQNEIGSVGQISKDAMSSQFSPKTKPTRWRSQDEMAIVTSVLDAIKSGLLGEKLGSDVEWRKQSKLWQHVHRQVQGKTGKKCRIDQVCNKFMRLRVKFLNARKKLHKGHKIQLSSHEKELFKKFQEILHIKHRTSTALSEKKNQKSKASKDLQQPCLQMNNSECFESGPLRLTDNEAQQEQHGQMEISTARAELDALMDMKDARDKCKELREETRAICKEIWQSCEQKFLEMQSKLTEMLETKMQDLKESQSVKSTSLGEMGFFHGDSSCNGEDDNSRMHLVMERHLKHRSRKLQLMQELCRIEKEELETEYLASRIKGLISNVVK